MFQEDIWKMNQVLSVIVPIYNKEKYVEKCVNSIQKWGGVSV